MAAQVMEREAQGAQAVEMSAAQAFLFGRYVDEMWAEVLQEAADRRAEQLMFEAKVKALMEGLM